MNTKKSVFFTNKVLAKSRAKQRNKKAYKVGVIENKIIYAVSESLDKAYRLAKYSSLKFDKTF